MSTATEPTLRLEDQVCFALYSAARAAQQAYRPLLDELGLTYPQYLVLLVLWEQDGQTVSALGERLHLDSGTLSPLLRRLDEHGFIARERQTTDSRRVTVRLTAAGEALRERAVDVQRCLLDAVGLSGADLLALRDLSRRFVAAG
ncbi:MarR family transcriptional regulator [Citricoccus sp. I39-566]|uniref:MarR family winged helix-turn-helix transcriptional regulator n=1 Tax=Citricoccus sp. I39-566 TaxID=3073268 RepID=UPI00286BC54E|nr:MarR family transcriptional regulator [Citricoccus sp. I39-566]WMY78487.1 MarR family transcriptional regulator [Citricoccus sp. I39-566]